MKNVCVAQAISIHLLLAWCRYVVSSLTVGIYWNVFLNCYLNAYILPREISSEVMNNTVYPKKYAHDFVVLDFVVVMQSFIMNSHEVFIHIHQGCFAGTGAIVRLPQCQWSKSDGYVKISQCITTTKHSKAVTVCIFLGIYCTTRCEYVGIYDGLFRVHLCLKNKKYHLMRPIDVYNKNLEHNQI